METLNEQQTKQAQEKLAQDLNRATEFIKNNKVLLTAGIAAQKVGEYAVKGIDQATKAKRVIGFFGSTVVSSFKEAMKKKQEQDKAIEQAINLFRQK